MCILTTDVEDVKERSDEFLHWYRYELMNLFPNLVSVVHAVNDKNGVNVGEIKFIEGKDFIPERILGIDYKISPFSFFQTNSYQLDVFIQLILDVAKIKKTDIV